MTQESEKQLEMMARAPVSAGDLVALEPTEDQKDFFQRFLGDLERVSHEGADIDTLRQLRALLDRQHIRDAFSDHYEGLLLDAHGDRLAAQLLERLRGIEAAFEDSIGTLESDRFVVEACVIGGGVALVASGILTLVAPGIYPLLPFLPMAAGVLLGSTGILRRRQLHDSLAAMKGVLDRLRRVTPER